MNDAEKKWCNVKLSLILYGKLCAFRVQMIKEVDALRQEASEKLQKANEQLADVKELAMGYRQTIKNNFPLEQWKKFGISDKR